MRNRGPAQIPKRIDSIKFSLMNPNEIRKMSSVEVKTADTYKDDGHAYKQGLMDPKMGVIDPGVRCDTCGNKYEDCPSHFGHISLELPVIHIGFTQLIKLALKATCNSCSKVLLHDKPGTHPIDPETVSYTHLTLPTSSRGLGDVYKRQIQLIQRSPSRISIDRESTM